MLRFYFMTVCLEIAPPPKKKTAKLKREADLTHVDTRWRISASVDHVCKTRLLHLLKGFNFPVTSFLFLSVYTRSKTFKQIQHLSRFGTTTTTVIIII